MRLAFAGFVPPPKVKKGTRNSALREFVLRTGGLSACTVISVLRPQLRDLCLGCCGSSGLGAAPSDPGDLSGCVKALELLGRFGDSAAAIQAVARRHPAWRPIAAAWDEIISLYVEEMKDTRSRYFPETYEAMRRARSGGGS